MSNNHKVLIIGLDGGTWRILKPMMDNGIMPNLKKLVDSGISGILKSTIPPVTAPAWSSFQTGVNPGKHGIYDFQNHNKETKELQFINSNFLNLPTIWELAAQKGRKVVSINVPLTYPVKKAENWMQIGGFLAPQISEEFVYPKELLTRLRENDYQIALNGLHKRFIMKLDKFIEENIKIEETRFDLAKQLAREVPWDLFMVHNQSIDGIQHVYYPYLEPGYPEYQKVQSQTISRFYKKTDVFIGDLIKVCPTNTIVWIVSDHGFKRVNKKINLNNWLSKKGFLRFNKRRTLTKKAVQFMVDLDKLNLRQKLFGRVLGNLAGMKIASISTKYFIDWDNTKAYMLNGNTFGNIFLNCKKEERERLIDKIKKELFHLTDANGQKVVKTVYESNRHFEGGMVSKLPDLFIEPEEDYVFTMPIMRSKKIFYAPDKSELQGTHHPDGIFAASGPTIKQGRVATASIMDVTPTVLAILDIPIPVYMDGKVINTIFHEKPNVRFSDQGTQDVYVSHKTEQTTDEPIIRSRLKGLGYL